jgi:mannose/fructose/N-acetylgalactosamine-specific phosphotransferase system component IID
MWIVAVGWMFVVLMAAAAEAASTQGTVLGALFTLLFWGVLPLSVVLYLMGAPARWRTRTRAEQQARLAALAEPASHSCAGGSGAEAPANESRPTPPFAP